MTAEILAWAGRQLTLAYWEAIPHDEQFRLELVEGVLSIMQRPLSLHQRAVVRITALWSKSSRGETSQPSRWP